MKVIFTLVEVEKFLRRHLNLMDDTKIVISRPRKAKAVVSPEVVKAQELIEAIQKLDYTYTQKIAAIKLFREYVSCGLAQAKWAIENWGQVRNFMACNQRLPKFEGDYYTSGGMKMT